jgi:hypothetical protein
MKMDLVQQFFAEEFNEHVRKLICESAERESVHREIERFEFDRFNIVLDFKNQIAILEDDLDATASGTLSLPLREFLSRVRCQGGGERGTDR